MPRRFKKLRLILGDQLNINHTWFTKQSPDVLYTLMEIRPESEYVTHHIQKIISVFSAMRNFAAELEASGHEVKYFRINDDDNDQSFEGNLTRLISTYGITSFEYMEPDEYRLDVLFHEIDLPRVETRMVSAGHFMTSRSEVEDFFGEKQPLMENFYRYMREKHDILMEGGKPVTGKWNYDQSNRKKLPRGHSVPDPLLYTNDVSEVYRDIDKAGLDYIGSVDKDNFTWPVSRQQAIGLLDFFCTKLLPDFGRYQDALSDSLWSLYHSRLSQSMNLKLISPAEAVKRASATWQGGHADIAQVEGFVRQIIGWREYMRGLYWMKMPGFSESNFFEHYRPLPSWFWDADTGMRCLSKAIGQSLEYAYAHHIQRLMVTGNFCLLAGVHPDAVDEWYLGIYIDAFEWVEMTNTRGMSQYADGGLVGSKPYVSSANYIHKMGDHCTSCRYDPRKKTGSGSCPFNSLYWHFIDRHRHRLENNPRMTMMYRLWDKNNDKAALLEQATYYLDKLEDL